MRGRNINIYFSEEIYNQIKPLIEKRKVSQFVNQAVEKELAKGKQQAREQLITAHQRLARQEKTKKEKSFWDEAADDYLNKN